MGIKVYNALDFSVLLKSSIIFFKMREKEPRENLMSVRQYGC